MQSFDVIVIGGGPGGYVAAIKSAENGKKTALIEKENLGGVCLNWGCIPTKSLLRNAEIIRDIQQGDLFGFEVSGVKVDYKKAYLRSRKVSEKLGRGVEYLMKKNKITVFKDTAKFIGKKEIVLLKSKEELSAKNIIIATGSKPFNLPMLDYAKSNVLDSKKALQLEEVPKNILIVGAGAIGMEFATIFASYGAKVIVIEMQANVLPNEDIEVSTLMKKEFIKRGIKIHTSTKLIDVKNDGKKVIACVEENGKKVEIITEYILCAIGIKPESDELSLKDFGYKVDAKGYIEVNEKMQTNVLGVYAIGDITGKLPLAHVASAQGVAAVNDICKIQSKQINYDNVPKCTYALPECASAGLTEKAAKERGYDVGSSSAPLSSNGKAISYGNDIGFVKLVFDKKYGQLLGAHMVGIHVTEMIWGIVGYLGMEMTLEEMSEVIHPHPTVSETIFECL